MFEPLVIAVINTSPDVIDMLRLVFEHAGFVTVSAFTYDIREGRVDIQGFMQQHNPRVVVYDIAPPYDANWQLFQHLSTRPFMRDRSVVITTTNAAYVQTLVGSDRRVYEIVGKPVDLDELVRAVKEATRSRSVYERTAGQRGQPD